MCFASFWENGETSSMSLLTDASHLLLWHGITATGFTLKVASAREKASERLQRKAGACWGTGGHFILLHSNVQKLTDYDWNSFSLVLKLRGSPAENWVWLPSLSTENSLEKVLFNLDIFLFCHFYGIALRHGNSFLFSVLQHTCLNKPQII